jgi:hypothetical protein
MTKRTTTALRLIAFACLVLPPAWASADSWRLPSAQTTSSANGQFRVTVTPRPLDGQLAYFSDKVKGEEPAGQARGEEQKSPTARVERHESDGNWRLVWQMPLVNDVAPVSVLLADDASFLVTFDNWHSAGYGDDVVVIYDRQGDLVRKLALEQILPPAYTSHFPRSVSSRWWGEGHALVEGDSHVELKILPPGGDDEDVEANVPVRIRLADGVVVPPTGEAWEQALAEANRLEAGRMDAWRKLRELRVSPLNAPATQDTRAWRHYMFELRDRIVGEDEGMGGMLLAAPGEDRGFHGAEAISSWVSRFDDEDEYGRGIILASPASNRLAALLVKEFRGRNAGSMTNAHLVFVGTAAEGAQVREAAKPSGAKITLVDRTTPYPAGAPLPEVPHPLWEVWDP